MTDRRTDTKAALYIGFPYKPNKSFYFLVIRRSIVRTAGDMERQTEDKKRLVQVVEDTARGVRTEIVGPGDQEVNQL